MEREPNFAPALTDLRKSNLPGAVEIATAPTAGQGYALNEKGQNPVLAEDGSWRVKISEVAVNLASALEHAGDSVSVSVPGLQVGDYCFVLGQTTANTRAFLCFTTGLCTTEGQIPLQFFNTDDATVNPDEKTFYFLCIHRGI